MNYEVNHYKIIHVQGLFIITKYLVTAYRLNFLDLCNQNAHLDKLPHN